MADRDPNVRAVDAFTLLLALVCFVFGAVMNEIGFLSALMSLRKHG